MKISTHTIILLFACMYGSLSIKAQDGEQLFKAKCNACHMVDKNSTGPLLKGVKQKWSDAGETELIYEWVKNPSTLISSGKSQMANAIKTFSPTEMPGQQVSKEEVDAILDYIDNYTPTASTSTDTGAVDSTQLESEKKVVPNYEENLTLFYWLATSIILLLTAIIVLSNATRTVLKSDYFKRKIIENSTSEHSKSSKLNTLLVLVGIGFMCFQNNATALTFYKAGEAGEDVPYLKVEQIDIYFMVAINIILLGVLIYLRRLFKETIAMTKPIRLDKTEPAADPFKKINTLLTDAVAIEDEHTILMEHEYDGIRELDNNLPPWWVWGFFATIVFAVIYLFNYHVSQSSDLQYTAYEKEMKQAKKDIDTYLSKMAMNVDETNVTELTDASSISAGKALFSSNCVACHNPNAEGNIGPNLTDDYWIYGPDIKSVFKTIKLGTANGMPEHASKLNPVQLQQVASFILQLPFTKGKAPDGKENKTK
jgi:cytochrome c oxidase cbb3-type subunit 3